MSRKRFADQSEDVFQRKKRVNMFTASTWWMVDLTIEPIPEQGATALVKRCMLVYGWDEVFARKVLKAYKQFLFVKVKEQDWDEMNLLSSVKVDMMWHQHILDTQNYTYDCIQLCGSIVHHKPDAAYDNEEARAARHQNTAKALVAHYDKSDLDTSSDGVWAEVFRFNTKGNDSFHILAKSLTGQEILINTSPTDTIADLKAMLMNATGIPDDQLRLIFSGKQLKDDRTVGDYEMQNMSVLHFITWLRGC